MGAMDELINAEALDTLCDVFARAGTRCAHTAALASPDALGDRTLRQRVDLVAGALDSDWPSGLDAVAELIESALLDERFVGWMLWPVGEASVSRVLAAHTGDVSHDAAVHDVGLDLMAQLTPRFSSEFAIRRLAASDLDATVAAAERWAVDPDPHVRRLASEGLRPYLPWAIRVPEIIARPEACLGILDVLADDPDEVVRRSAANHLNDISRHAPEVVIETASRWMARHSESSTMTATVRHALRTLVKKGHPGALAILGYRSTTLRVDALDVTPTVTLPGHIEVHTVITNDGDSAARVAVDYVVHYQKASGETAPKVFKWASIDLDAGESRALTKRHGLRQMTTRVHYPGIHHVEVQLNGERHGRANFTVAL